MRHLRDLVSLVQLKRREKHPLRSVTFSFTPATLLKVTLSRGCFSRFLNFNRVRLNES